jgi:predicted metal-dependent HD superfamily phosphohydrolase
MTITAKVKPEQIHKIMKDGIKVDAFDAMLDAYHAEGRYYEKMDAILLILEQAEHLVNCVGKE